MLKLKMMLCVMMLPLVVVSCVEAVCQSVREATTTLTAWIMQPPPTGRPAERDYFTLRRLITMQKQLEGTQKYINEQCTDRVAHIDGQLVQCVSNTHALPAEYKCLK